MKINLVLSGGGARAAWQAGVLDGLRSRAFFDHNPIYTIQGTSGGALNGATIYSYNWDDLRHIWTDVVGKWFYPTLGSGVVKHLLKRYVKKDPMSDVTFMFNVTSLANGNSYVLTPEDFHDDYEFRNGLFASACTPVPMFFHPVSRLTTKAEVIYNVADGGISNRWFLDEEDDDQVLIIDTDAGFPDTYQGKNPFVSAYTAFQMAIENNRKLYPDDAWVIHPTYEQERNGLLNNRFDFRAKSLEKGYHMGHEMGAKFADQKMNTNG